MTTTDDAGEATTEVARYEPPELDLAGGSRTARTLELAPASWQLATKIAGTPFVPKGLRGQPEAVLACVLYGDELGLGFMQALKSIHVIEGTPAISADLTRALILREGHELWLEEASPTKAVLGGRRKGQTEPTYVTWTIEDAKRANLDRKTNWRTYPRAMLIARATGELARVLFPDVILNLAIEEEARDGFLDEEGTAPASEELAGGGLGARPDDVPAPAAPTTTRKASTKRPATKRGTHKASAAKAAAPPPTPPAPPLPGEPGFEDPTGTAADAEPVEAEIVDEAPPAPSGHDLGAIEEAEVVDDDGGPLVAPDGAGPQRASGYSPAQAVAIRARELGIDEDTRHGVITAITAGRTSSGKDLEVEEVRLLLGTDDAAGLLERLAAGDYSLDVDTTDGGTAYTITEPGDDGEAVEVYFGAIAAQDGQDTPEDAQTDEDAGEPPAAVEEPEDAPVDVPEDEDGWRAWLKDRGIKLVDAIRTGAALSGDPRNAPTTLAQLAGNPELGAKVIRYLTEENHA